MSPLALFEVSLDCPVPRDLAEFYRRLLGWEYVPGHETSDPDGDEWLAIVPPGPGPRLAFQRSDAEVPPWRTGARVHFDVAVPDLDAGHALAVAAGARPLTGTPAEEGHADDPFRVYADPVGHPFCLTLVAAPPPAAPTAPVAAAEEATR
ncbi:VOC family protein [Oerskovia merdavium]|uniref:VOC family protein n=1 Tax=Oerskovia merdavium TaxID=2762227 RepID=A0ABR8TX70_9CELL|nr:VOC family protein [Oerskovia merdavium]MBD7980085.1 VOC family protein [Oerskovia merdavium]